jgi:hypothetical protein
MERSAKPNIGSSEEVTLSHIEKNALGLRKRREDKLAQKRRPIVSLGEKLNTLDLLKRLNYNEFMNSDHPIQSLTILDQILKQNDSFKYFGKCDENLNGPFLFEDPKILTRLINLLSSSSSHADIQILTSFCLSNIAAHEEPLLWVTRLQGVLPVAFNMLKIPNYPSKAKENLIWLLANMASDNYKLRDAMIKDGGICQIIMALKEKEDIMMLGTLAYLFKCIYSHQETFISSNPFWDFIILKVFNTMYHELPDEILLDILRGISSAIRMNDDQRVVFYNQTKYIMDLKRSKAIISEFGDICVSLARCVKIRPEVSSALSANFTFLLQQQSPDQRAQGALGLQILSVSFVSLKDLCHEEVLKTINTQAQYASDVSHIISSLRFCMCQMVICAKQGNVQAVVYPLLIEKLFIHLKLGNILYLMGDDNILIKGLEALSCLVKWDRRILNKMDDIETQLEILTGHRLEQVCELAERILEKDEMDFDLDE